MGDSIYYGNIIKIETDDWSRAPIIAIFNPPNNTKCPSDTDTIVGTFYGFNSRCNYINGSSSAGPCKNKQGLYNSSRLEPV
jgi:hypothetical protein